MRQVERHLIKPSNDLYSICDDLTFKSKNLYNAGLYQIRQSIFERNKSDKENKKPVLRWSQLVSEFRKQDQSDMKALPSKVSTNIIKMLGGNISSYYQLLKCYNDKSNKKITNKPNIPGYLHKKDGRYVAEFTNQTFAKKRGKNNELILCPRDLRISIPTKVDNPKCVKIIPRKGYFFIDVIYEVKEKYLRKSQKYAGNDLGVDNLAAVTFSDGTNPLLVKGLKVKHINQGYNRLISKSQSKLPNNQKTSKHIYRLFKNREMKLQSEFHKITGFLAEFFDEMSLEKVFVGKNVGLKSGISIGKKGNQNFVKIPHNKFISQLKYKCQLRGIEVVEQEESYTSKASFIDCDLIPVWKNDGKKYTFSGKRVKRGLYKTKNGKLINADVNGSYNILVKGLNNLGISLKRDKVSFHTRSLTCYNTLSNEKIVEKYK